MDLQIAGQEKEKERGFSSFSQTERARRTKIAGNDWADKVVSQAIFEPKWRYNEEIHGCMHVQESAIPSLDIHSGHPQGHLSIPSIPNFKALARGTTVDG